MTIKATRAKYLAIMLPIFGVALTEAMLEHEPFLGAINVLASRDAAGTLTVDAAVMLAHLICGFAVGEHGVTPFAPDVAAAVMIKSILLGRAA